MPLTNTLKPIVDQPVFEWCRFVPTRPTANASMCSSSDKSGRYLYYNVSGTFLRYDTYGDSWQELATITTATTLGQLKFHSGFGWRGIPVAATSSTITVGGFGNSKLMKGMKIRIISGTGAGQERTITTIADSVIVASGSASSYTTVGTATYLQDTSNKWRVNQWRGYAMRTIQGVGSNQVRRVLCNSTDSIYLQDTDLQGVDSFNNTALSTTSPFSSPASMSGVNAVHYTLESSVATVDSAWTVTPDSSSKFMILGGGVWFMGGTGAATPSTYTGYYDVATDTWYSKRGHTFFSSAISGDIQMEDIGEYGGPNATGTATSAGSRSLTNSGASMTVDRWANYQLRITGGTGISQWRRIVGNTATSFQLERNWDINPDSTSTYAVYPDSDKIWVSGNTCGLVVS